MTANESIFWGALVDYSQRGTGKPTYTSGGTITGTDALSLFEANVGKKCSIVHIGTRWYGSAVAIPFSSIQGACNTLTSAGRIPFVDWLCWDSPGHKLDYALRPERVAAGDWDAYITQYAQDVQAWGKPIIIRPWIEQNLPTGSTGAQFSWQYSNSGSYTHTSWFPVTITNVTGTTNPTITAAAHGFVVGQPIIIAGVGGVVGINGAQTVLSAATNTFTVTDVVSGTYTSGGTASQTFTNTYNGPGNNGVGGFIQAYQHMVSVWRAAGNTNAQFVWCPNIQSSSAPLSFASQYPGDAFTDILGWDGYGGTPDGVQRDFNNLFRGGGSTGLSDIYGLVSACDGTGIKPLMICETGWLGTVGSTINISSIARTGGTWTLTLASTPASEAVPTCSFDITGVTPSTYNGEWVIVSGSGTSWVVQGDSDHGSASGGTVQIIDRVNRATNITNSLEIHLPAMPRVKYWTLFWTDYGPDKWVADYDSSQPNNVDMLALKTAIGNAHYISGGTFGTDVASLSLAPFQDQPLTISGALERYRNVCRSTSGLVGAWLLRDAVSTNPVPDDSGNSRTGAVNGSVTLGSANVLPAEPSWTSAGFPGTTGSNISIASNAAFSPATNGHLSVETSFVLPTTPAGSAALVTKGSSGAFEWSLFVNGTAITFTIFNQASGTWATSGHNIPSLNVPHHVVACVDESLSATGPITMYLDNVQHTSIPSNGVAPLAGSAAVMIGQRADTTQPITAGTHIGPTFIYNTTLTIETVADHYAAWIAAPAITVGPTVT